MMYFCFLLPAIFSTATLHKCTNQGIEYQSSYNTFSKNDSGRQQIQATKQAFKKNKKTDCMHKQQNLHKHFYFQLRKIR